MSSFNNVYLHVHTHTHTSKIIILYIILYKIIILDLAGEYGRRVDDPCELIVEDNMRDEENTEEDLGTTQRWGSLKVSHNFAFRSHTMLSEKKLILCVCSKLHKIIFVPYNHCNFNILPCSRVFSTFMFNYFQIFYVIKRLKKLWTVNCHVE